MLTMNSKIAVIGILAILIFSGFAVALNGSMGHKMNKISMEIERRYSARGIIKIDNDANFTAANGVVAGNGSMDNPYIIEGYSIDANGSKVAIYIGNTSSYFIIENCTLGNASSASEAYFGGAAILLYNVSHGTIKNVNMTNNNNSGIQIIESKDLTLYNTSAVGNIVGVYAENPAI